MKIHLLSDLHIEYSEFSLPKTDADIVVIAGDIGIGLAGLEWIHNQRIKQPVIFVPGNHDYYHNSLSLIKTLKSQAQKNVFVMDNDALELEGVRFLGSTLWTDFACFGYTMRQRAMLEAQEKLSDFSDIRYQSRLFTPEDALMLHEKSCHWLTQKLSEEYDGKTIVITHHAPSMSSVHPRYEEDLITAAFVSSMEIVMTEERVGLWAHGHVHTAFDYEISGTRVICNPRGHPPYTVPNGFDPNLIIDI